MINNKIHLSVLVFIVAFFLNIPVYATTCSKSYTIGFFNGVWNTAKEASDGARELKNLIGNTYNNEPVKYENFYNHTGSSVGATALQDLAETFIQRSAEIDASGELGKRFEYCWEFLGSSEPTFLDKLAGFLPNAVSLFDSVYTAITNKLVAIISDFLSNPPTEEDYATHNAKLDALAADGQKLMLVGHSQGNLFMNHAYDYILPIVTQNRVAAAHIAPASPTLRGDYVLADIDVVINALRIQGVSSVPENNLTIPYSIIDISGHTFIRTYLDPMREGRERIKEMIESQIEGLKCQKYTEWELLSVLTYEVAVVNTNGDLTVITGIIHNPYSETVIYNHTDLPSLTYAQFQAYAEEYLHGCLIPTPSNDDLNMYILGNKWISYDYYTALGLWAAIQHYQRKEL